MNYLKILLPLMFMALLFSGCSSHNELRKVKNRWNIPENKDVKVFLVNGD